MRDLAGGDGGGLSEPRHGSHLHARLAQHVLRGSTPLARPDGGRGLSNVVFSKDYF